MKIFAIAGVSNLHMRTLSLLSVAAVFAPFIVEGAAGNFGGLEVTPDAFGDCRDIVRISKDTPAWNIEEINGREIAPPTPNEITKSTLAALTTGLVLLPPLSHGKLACAVVSGLVSLFGSLLLCTADPRTLRSPAAIHAWETFSSRFHISFVIFQLTRTIIGSLFGTAAPLHLMFLIPAIYSTMIKGDSNGRRMARFGYSMVIFWLMVEWLPKLWKVFIDVHPLSHY